MLSSPRRGCLCTAASAEVSPAEGPGGAAPQLPPCKLARQLMTLDRAAPMARGSTSVATEESIRTACFPTSNHLLGCGWHISRTFLCPGPDSTQQRYAPIKGHAPHLRAKDVHKVDSQPSGAFDLTPASLSDSKLGLWNDL